MARARAPPDDVLGLLGDALPLVLVKLIRGLGDKLEQLLLLVGAKGAAAREDDVEQHAERPEVGALAVRSAVLVVVVPREHLGRHVVGRAAEARQRLVGRPDPRVAKVYQLDVV
eukprot:1232547-Pleurochrysis_carterae.AAC.1